MDRKLKDLTIRMVKNFLDHTDGQKILDHTYPHVQNYTAQIWIFMIVTHTSFERPYGADIGR